MPIVKPMVVAFLSRWEEAGGGGMDQIKFLAVFLETKSPNARCKTDIIVEREKLKDTRR